MDKIVTNELAKTILLLSLGITALSALTLKLITKVSAGFKPQQKITIIYLLVFFLFFAFAACTTSITVLKDHIFFYIICQFYFLLLGIAHIHYMPAYLKWSSNEKSIWLNMFFTIIAAALGSIGFIIVYRFFNTEGLEYNMATSICTFIIPWFFYQTFQKVIEIPPKILKQWFYPLNEEIEEPDGKFKNERFISFEFQKHSADAHITNFRSKAPVDMEFGKLFYYFINEYNERYPNTKIQFDNGAGKPHGWIFYKKPKWHTLITKYVDADRTVLNNNIKENDIIICSRLLN